MGLRSTTSDSDDYDDEHDYDKPTGKEGQEKWCPDCGWVTTKWVDDGIGAYEYWGAREVHSDWTEVCPVCEAGVMDLFDMEHVEVEVQFAEHAKPIVTWIEADELATCEEIGLWAHEWASENHDDKTFISANIKKDYLENRE